MPNRTHLTATARRLKEKLNGDPFLTIPRYEITTILREVSGESTTRMKSQLAHDLTSALVNEAVLVYPPLAETTTGDTVRLYRAGTVLAQLIDTILHPDPGTDKDLDDVLHKVESQWVWAPVHPSSAGK